jgi:hypothetical protein
MSKRVSWVSVVGDVWTVATSRDGEVPKLVRFRQNIDPDALGPHLPHLVCVSWSMVDATELGLPSDDETQELERFENELVPRVEAGSIGLLAAVITECSQRHWYFYLNDRNGFSDALHDVPQKEERYPIEITIQENEGWRLFREVSAGCKGKAS